MNQASQTVADTEQASTTNCNQPGDLEIKLNDVIRLKKPYCPSEGKRLQVGIVVEVLGNGSLFAVKFNNYKNVCDFGRSLIAEVIPDPLDN